MCEEIHFYIFVHLLALPLSKRTPSCIPRVPCAILRTISAAPTYTRMDASTLVNKHIPIAAKDVGGIDADDGAILAFGLL